MEILNALTPPPPRFGGSAMKRPLATLAAALVAMVIAGPVVAQSTVTAPGLYGNPACAGRYSERNVNAFDSTHNGFRDGSLTNTNVNFKLSNIMTWTNLKAVMGITDNPVSSITVYGKVKNARTGMLDHKSTLEPRPPAKTPPLATTTSPCQRKRPMPSSCIPTSPGAGRATPSLLTAS